jgi:calpain
MSEEIIYKLGDKKSGIHRTSTEKVQDFYELRNQCLRDKKLFEDNLFPANDSSYYLSGMKREIALEWVRPSALAKKPLFISEGAQRFDVIQGSLGNCWLLAAVANLTLNQKLFERVVPKDQTCDGPQYAGIFHFRFWQYGRWIEVVIDDRLPTFNGKLVLMHSRDGNEFWSALLEKAYAKLYGSYQALDGGLTVEAMEDFTGGLAEQFDIGSDECPKDLLNIMLKACERESLLSCSIEVKESSQIGSKSSNGLVLGHAYSVTAVKLVEVKTSKVEGKLPLIRLRNPWGNETEWKGAWSDSSREWTVIPDQEKKDLGLIYESDGEFWMSFQDFKINFSKLEICNLSPDSLADNQLRRWEVSYFEGAWINGISAGGCRKFLDTFHLNPQYLITLVDPDEYDNEDLCTCVIALMQKNSRPKRNMGLGSLCIGFAVYQVKEDRPLDGEAIAQTNYDKGQQLLTNAHFRYNATVALTKTFINLREVNGRFRFKPGKYCIIPSTYDPNQEGEFVIRLFTEKPAKDVFENDDNLELVDSHSDVQNGELNNIQKSITESEYSLKSYFPKLADENKGIDAAGLQQILNQALGKEFHLNRFSIDSCRSMIAMYDFDRSGQLSFNELTQLWKHLRLLCLLFKKYDIDDNNIISAQELKIAFYEIGLKLNRSVLQHLILRYGVILSNDNDIVNRGLKFDDFIHSSFKLKNGINFWNNKYETTKSPKSGISLPYVKYSSHNKLIDREFTFDEFIERLIYS